MITEVAGVGLNSQMYSFDMPIQISCQECFVVTEFTGKAGLDLQMYHFTMSFQITRIIRFVITLATVKSFDSLMDSFDMIVKEMLMNGFVITQMASKFFTFFVS